MSKYEEAIRKANEAGGAPARRPTGNWLQEWITSDCRNKLCVEGTVSIDDGKNRRLYRCPLCDRSPIPTAAVYRGPIEEWTADELQARMHDRRDVYYDKEFRYERGKEVIGMLRSLMAGGKEAEQ